MDPANNMAIFEHITPDMQLFGRCLDSDARVGEAAEDGSLWDATKYLGARAQACCCDTLANTVQDLRPIPVRRISEIFPHLLVLQKDLKLGS
jgi:hypothetical protein